MGSYSCSVAAATLHLEFQLASSSCRNPLNCVINFTGCVDNCCCVVQQRFAEGLATHLTSGTDLHSSISRQYDDVLAGLPADPNMAGLLEPLVLPAEAYQIPAHLKRMAHEQDHHQPASACFMDRHQQPAPLQLSCPVLGRPGQPQAPSHQLALPASRLSRSASQAECTGPPQAHDSGVAVQPDGQQVVASTNQLQLCGGSVQQQIVEQQTEHPAMLADAVEHNATDEQQQLCWEQAEQEHEDSLPQDYHVADMLASHELVQAAALPQHERCHPATHSLPSNASSVFQEGRAQAQALPAVKSAQQEVQAVRALLPQAAEGTKVGSSGMPAPAANTSGQQNTALPGLGTCRQMVMTGAPAVLAYNHPAEPQKTARWQHQQQRKHAGAAEQASLDNLYATIFPNRQATQPLTGSLLCRLTFGSLQLSDKTVCAGYSLSACRLLANCPCAAAWSCMNLQHSKHMMMQ